MTSNKILEAWIAEDSETYTKLVSELPFEDGTSNESDEIVEILVLNQTVEELELPVKPSEPR